jgi:hypothetical protein
MKLIMLMKKKYLIKDEENNFMIFSFDYSIKTWIKNNKYELNKHILKPHDNWVNK